MPPNNPILALESLSVSLGPATLLRDVSFTLERGEMLCIIGESGAGKSTLLKALQGLMPARCKRFFFEPAGIETMGEMPRGVGLPRSRWVMQDPLAALNPRQTLGASIAESLHRRRSDIADMKAAVLTALERVELGPEFYGRLPGQISVGQAQRACLARAMIAEPELIFFDEPLSALDALVQKKIAYRMDVLRRETQMTYVVVTHDIGFAASYADQVLVLKSGQVEVYQRCDAFFDAPGSAYAKDLISAASALGALHPGEAQI
jgi:peptide/nickel transport system ATP-binding protein